MLFKDYRYEGGSGGTPETINMYLLSSTGCVLESAAVGNASNEFVYKITDDDQPPFMPLKILLLKQFKKMLT